jgi:diaminopimelate epimerase
VKTRGGEELTIYFEPNGDRFDQVWLEGNTSVIYAASLHDEAL